MDTILQSLNKLCLYCEKEKYRGWDPYDGLNSRLFQKIPFLKQSSFCRLLVIQGFKRSPLNFRKIALVPKDYNAKGIGLLLSAYCNIFNALSSQSDLIELLGIGSLDDIKQRIVELSDLLISLQSIGYSGACWGYNFDWQAGGKGMFLFPKNTPTVVATNFCATALMEAYEIIKDKRYLNIALSSAKFVINDLHRHKHKDGFLFSYSPMEGNDTVFNASLLGARLLSFCFFYTGNEVYKQLAEETLSACCHSQDDDGSWTYGLSEGQQWIDSFHTGYNLDAIISYQNLTGDKRYNVFLKKGIDFYIKNFFEKDGTPKYYHNKIYPIDIHCPGQLFVTVHKLGIYKQYKDLVEKVFLWTIDHMQDRKGFFYYQKKAYFSSKISYMRWSNAFMLNALSCLLLDEIDYCQGRIICNNKNGR